MTDKLVERADLEQRARDMLAAEYKNPDLALATLINRPTYDQKFALRAITKALASSVPEQDRLLELADKAVEWALDSFGGYCCEEVDAGIHYMQARGKDRWSMQSQMEADTSWLPDEAPQDGAFQEINND